MRRTVPLFVTVVALLASVATAGAGSPPPPPPPPSGSFTLPEGPMTQCKMDGPAFVVYGVHAPNGPPYRGHRYLVHAWGITCARAKELLRAFFPRIPAHPMGRLSGGPKGFVCKGHDPKGTVTKSKAHDGSCRRSEPPAIFDWGPAGSRTHPER